MNQSKYYTDHLVAALRCLDNNQLRQLATEILNRLPSEIMNTLKTKPNGKREIENEMFIIELNDNQLNSLEGFPDGEISTERMQAVLALPNLRPTL